MSTVYSGSSFSGEPPKQSPQNGNEANHPFIVKYSLLLLVLNFLQQYKKIE